MEMEAKEELEVLKNAPENDRPPAAASDGLNNTVDEIILAQDYSTFSKKEFVMLLKELARQGDFRKVDAVLREIKNHFDQILEKDRSEALKKFIEEGGSPNDFEYRPDLLETTFEANHKLLKDRRAEHYRNLGEQKSENLRIKNSLLEELRKLVDGEDDKHSFDKFKEIQKQWRETGQVPTAHMRTLWANYHALVDRFYDNRNIYFELKELDRRKNLEAKFELCHRAEKLASVAKISVAIRELNDLHEDYRHIGPVAREEKDAVWERFKKASNAVYERRDAFVAQLQETLSRNLGMKDQIIAEVTTFTTFQSDRIKEWNQKTSDIIGIQKNWEAIGAVPHARSREINKRFWAAFKTFFNNKGLFFKRLDESRLQNLQLKKDLIQQAEALKSSQQWDATADELKALQIKWKEIGPVPEKQRDKIFQEFRATCDFFFEQRRVKLEEAEKELYGNLEKKEAICSELEKMISDKSGSLEQLKELQRNFQSIGFVPHQSVASIKSRFSSALNKFIASLEQVSQQEKDQAMLEIQLENLKTDPDAGYKIQVREQSLRKRIAKEENDLAILKNNLGFFGRSKNADKVRAEFNEKINAAELELGKLKGQLKLLRAAVH